MPLFYRLCFIALFTVFVSGCASTPRVLNTSEKAAGYYDQEHEQCVPYARRVSGINLMGNAYTWWTSAAGIYARGQQPQPNAVLVLARSNKLRNGHLAVVTQVLSPREIDVTHRNWGNDRYSRRIVYQSLRVQDISPDNSWTNVRMWNPELNVFGLPYPAYGFIYNAKL